MLWFWSVKRRVWELRMHLLCLILLVVPTALGQPGKCDHRPRDAPEASSNKDNPFTMTLDRRDGKFLPDQTYVLILETTKKERPFQKFIITAEDPNIDNSTESLDPKQVDVGSLKTLGEASKSRYREECYNSVENTDDSPKQRIEVHWKSPKSTETNTVRFRAMAAENKEVWYEGENLTIVLEKDDDKPLDSPPVLPNEICSLCSEARYKVIFKGRWSRGSHPRHYPSKPDENFYSHMVGASHSYHYILWQQGDRASEGLKLLAETANITVLEREIISAMSSTNGTRTLIRGKKHIHPHMSEASHSLFRVDNVHHLFSFAVAMRPSPDWFLGTSRFELCTAAGWLESSNIPLYPWDAGTMDGISYESPSTVTHDNIERVAVGSFDKESPFYQMNLNDMKPFALLEVNRLDVYPLKDCPTQDAQPVDSEPRALEIGKESDPNAYQWRPVYHNRAPQEEPVTAESRQDLEKQKLSECGLEWSKWSSCEVDGCGPGVQYRLQLNVNPDAAGDHELDNCKRDQENSMQHQPCFVEC